MSAVIDIIKYFAKYPNKQGVLKNFARTTENMAGYNNLRDYINALPAPVIPELTDYIFSTDEKEIANRIKNIRSYFLFLEYGAIQSSSPDSGGARNTEFNLAITVAHHNDRPGTDIIEESLYMDNCLKYLLQIREQMELDDEEDICPIASILQSGIDISPIEPNLLYQSFGWVMSFRKREGGL